MKKKEEEKIKAFKEKLPRTMKFWPRDAKKRITIQEDLDFLVSMESVKRGQYGGNRCPLGYDREKGRG